MCPIPNNNIKSDITTDMMYMEMSCEHRHYVFICCVLYVMYVDMVYSPASNPGPGTVSILFQSEQLHGREATQSTDL